MWSHYSKVEVTFQWFQNPKQHSHSVLILLWKCRLSGVSYVCFPMISALWPWHYRAVGYLTWQFRGHAESVSKHEVNVASQLFVLQTSPALLTSFCLFYFSLFCGVALSLNKKILYPALSSSFSLQISNSRNSALLLPSIPLPSKSCLAIGISVL